MDISHGYAPVGAAQLYYEVAGEGQPLVFIHAGVADRRQWDHEFVHFARDHRVLRYDMRGYGRSEPVAGEYSNLGDLVALLDHLGWQQPLVLVGCSMGGSMAMDFALAHPSLVRALVMVDSAPSGLYLDVAAHPKEAEAEAAQEAGDLERVAQLEAQIWFDGMGRTPEQVNQEMRQLALAMNRIALTHAAKRLGTRQPNAATPAAGRLDALQIPVLIIVGEHDEPYTLAAADYMLEHIASAHKEVIADAAHLPNMEHPARFQQIVRSFLTQLAA